MRGCVLPVSAADALAWSVGQLEDVDLLLRSPLVPEAVFISFLPGRADYHDLLRKVRYWHKRGAVFLVMRTGNEKIERHFMIKNQGVRSFTEPGGKCRYVAPPAEFARWVAKWSPRLTKNAPATAQ